MITTFSHSAIKEAANEAVDIKDGAVDILKLAAAIRGSNLGIEHRITEDQRKEIADCAHHMLCCSNRIAAIFEKFLTVIDAGISEHVNDTDEGLELKMFLQHYSSIILKADIKVPKFMIKVKDEK